ncbi:MAG: hypothetical protein R3331_07260 [Sulfurospirillaceae bacterium]|nr:hypothetical protein [Sulfurospirillaceae bacterium]
MKQHNVLIRCDASSAIGLGHITRCLAIANDFRHNGHQVYFATKNFDLGIKKIQDNNFEIFFADDASCDYHNWIINTAKDKDITIFIGDVRDELPIKTIQELKTLNVLTVAIDQCGQYAKECDLCFYPPHAKINSKEYKGKVYQGFEYVLLRNEFYEPFKKIQNEIPNVLVMMGGTDPYSLTLPVIEQLLSLPLNINISVILSKGHVDYHKISILDKKIRTYSDIKDMSAFLGKIDFAIVSFGISAYEVLTKSIPAIHICLNDDHFQASEIFEKNKFAKRFMRHDVQDIKALQLNRAFISPIKKNKIYEEIICG